MSRRPAPFKAVLPVPRVQIVPQQPCPDTLALARRILDEAAAGRIVGLAMCLVRPGNVHEVKAAGRFAHDPILARGSVAMLDDMLRDAVGLVIDVQGEAL